MRISVFTWEGRETKKIISFFNLVLDQLQVYSDLTYFRDWDTDLVLQRTETCKVLEHILNLSFLKAMALINDIFHSDCFIFVSLIRITLHQYISSNNKLFTLDKLEAHFLLSFRLILVDAVGTVWHRWNLKLYSGFYFGSLLPELYNGLNGVHLCQEICQIGRINSAQLISTLFI